jgi:hypothetical protein
MGEQSDRAKAGKRSGDEQEDITHVRGSTEMDQHRT